MMKKSKKYVLLCLFLVLIATAVFNTYKWIVCGEQTIRITTSKQAYTDSDLYVSILAYNNEGELETKSKVKLLDSDGDVVKGVEVSYKDDSIIISVPQVEPGNYTIEAKVSSKAGKDTVQEDIYIADSKQENITITFDKGIYKPRR